MKKKIALIAVNSLLLIALAAALIASGMIRGTLRSQQAASAFSGESGESFAQLSAFFSEDSGFDENSIMSIRDAVEKALSDAAIDDESDENDGGGTNDEGGEGGRVLYTDAWSAWGEVSLRSSLGSAQAKACAVGGDFFLFHPLYLRDGSYLSPDDLMKDRIVLDEELAWRLFGSVQLEGLEVMIGDKPFIIAGVVSREDDFASGKAYTDGAGLFMSIEALRELTEDTVHITSYELVMSDPITGFALKTLTDALPIADAVIVENSRRYTLESTFKNIGEFGERSIHADGMIYPYWENAARYTEDWLALLLVLTLLVALCPGVCAVIYGVKLIRFGIGRGKRALAKKIDKREDIKAQEYCLEHEEEYTSHDIADIVREFLEENARSEEETVPKENK
ncbi:MAG: ABC transporter permease [Oscillospiraceae bacterium]|nr:ABC transporter permease [Oscillospiraceae bacterium]